MLKPFTEWITTNSGKFWKSWGYQTTWLVSWETCMQVKKQQSLTCNNWLVQNLERSITRLYIVTLFIWVTRRIRHEKRQAGWLISWNQDCRNINNILFAYDTTLTSESEEELLMRVKEETEIADLKVNVLKTKIMASSPITSLQIEAEKWKQWQILFSWAPKSMQTVTSTMTFKKHLLFGRKAVTNLDSMSKIKDINHLATKDL